VTPHDSGVPNPGQGRQDRLPDPVTHDTNRERRDKNLTPRDRDDKPILTAAEQPYGSVTATPARLHPAMRTASLAQETNPVAATASRGLRAFSSSNLRTTPQAMADAQHSDADQQRVIVAREKIAICDTKLDRYRDALDAGTDPVLVQQWITHVQAEKATAAADLRQITGRRTMTVDEISTLVDAMSGIATILRQADPADKAEVYQQLGIRLTYKPGLRLIQAEASPSGSCTKVCPEGDLNPHCG
jgi:hypothetical protein